MKSVVLLLCSLFPFLAFATEVKRDVLVFLKKEVDLREFQGIRDPQLRHKRLFGHLVEAARSSQNNLLITLRDRGFTPRSYYLPNMIFVKGATRSLMYFLQARPEVKRLVVNNPFSRTEKSHRFLDDMTFTAGSEQIGENLKSIGVDEVWRRFRVRGKGIVIGTSDGGVQWDHPALVKQYRGYSEAGVEHDNNWHDAIHFPLADNTTNSCGYDTAVPCDTSGHGTHTIGTAVGGEFPSNMIGAAPEAQWIGCRSLDQGIGSILTYLECLEFFFAPYPVSGFSVLGNPALAPNIITNSYYCSADEGCDDEDMRYTLEALRTVGIMMVVGAGNDGPECGTISGTPGVHSDLSYSVGALRTDDLIANFSSRGPSRFDGGVGPDISAPGVDVRSALPGSVYGVMSGTSMSTPLVSGVVALLWSTFPKLKGNIVDTTNILNASAKPITAGQDCGGRSGMTIPNNTYGHGKVDAPKAFRMSNRL